MPEITRNSEILEKATRMKKRIIIVFNKCDLVRRDEVEKLKSEYPDSYFVSGLKKEGVKKLKAYLDNLADNWSRPSLRVGIVGYPNVGKSTLINLLAPRAYAKVSSVSGMTKKTQWVRNGRLRIMDSPGVIPFGDRKVKVGMSSAKDPHKLKNPEKVAFEIIDYLMRKDSRVLEKFYGVKDAKDIWDLFEKIARKKNYLVKGAEVDENRTATQIISDWQKGRISLR